MSETVARTPGYEEERRLDDALPGFFRGCAIGALTIREAPDLPGQFEIRFPVTERSRDGVGAPAGFVVKQSEKEWTALGPDDKDQGGFSMLGTAIVGSIELHGFPHDALGHAPQRFCRYVLGRLVDAHADGMLTEVEWNLADLALRVSGER